MYRAIIVEDEPAEAQRLQSLLLRYGKENGRRSRSKHIPAH